MITKKIAIAEEAREEIYYKEGVLLPKEINFSFNPQDLTEENRRLLDHPDYNNVILKGEYANYKAMIRPIAKEDLKDPIRVIKLLREYCAERDSKEAEQLAADAKRYLAGSEFWCNNFEKFYPACVAERTRRKAEREAAEEAKRQHKTEQEEQAAAEFAEFLNFADDDTKAQFENEYITRADCVEEIETYVRIKTGYHADPTGNVEKFTRPTAAQIETAKREDAVIYTDEEGKLYLNKIFRFAGFKFDLYKGL